MYVMKARQCRQRSRAVDGRWANVGAARPLDVDNLMATDLVFGTPKKNPNAATEAMSTMKQALRRKRSTEPFQAYEDVVKQTVHQLRVSKREARQTSGVGWRVWRGARDKLAERRDAKPRGRPLGWRKNADQ